MKRTIFVISVILLLTLSACGGQAIRKSADGASMGVEEYKSFMRSMDSQISGALQMLDQSINQFRQKIITKEDFLFGISEGFKTLQIAENSFINARPPQQFSKGHTMITEGVSLLKNGMTMMKQAVEQNNDETYKQSVQKFSTGIQKIQQGNAELKKNL